MIHLFMIICNKEKKMLLAILRCMQNRSFCFSLMKKKSYLPTFKIVSLVTANKLFLRMVLSTLLCAYNSI